LVIIGLIVLVGIVGYVLVGNNSQQEGIGVSSPTKVSVVLDWFPWSAHAGLYVAKERGYFADEGLEVEFRVPSDPATVLQTVATGRDDFGLNYNTDVLVARGEDVPIVSVMGVVQHPLNSVMTLKESGIAEPRGLVGKKVGWPGVPSNVPILESMLKSQGHSLDEVEMVNVGFETVPALIGKQVDAIVGAYWVVESILIENQGFPVNIMRVEQHGVPDYYELVLVTSEEKIANEPELVQRFVRAAKRGYEDAMADPQGAVQLMKQVNPEMDLAVDGPGVDLLAPLWRPENGVFGWQEESRWLDFAQWMKDNGLLAQDVDPRQAFDNSFVEDAR